MTLLALFNAPSFPEAKCAEEPHDFFFPDTGVELNKRLPRLRELCGSCIHQAPCLSFALKNNESDGFWGGMTPDERSAIAQHKEARNKRHREIQEYLSQGLTKREIAELLKVQVASIDRTLDRAKRKGLTQ